MESRTNESIIYGTDGYQHLNHSLSGVELTDFKQSNESTSFFDTYYSQSRFIIETTLACMSVAINLLALVSTANAWNKRYTVYHTLFINMCVANMISLVLNWLCNNILFLFLDPINNLIASGFGVCKVSLCLYYNRYIVLFFNDNRCRRCFVVRILCQIRNGDHRTNWIQYCCKLLHLQM